MKGLVLFIHGFNATPDSFHSFPRDLNLDESVFDTAPFSYTNLSTPSVVLADQLVSFANDRPFVVLVGHSMGGIVALDASILLKERSSGPFIRQIICIDAPIHGLDTISRNAGGESSSLAVKAIGAVFLAAGYALSSSLRSEVNGMISQTAASLTDSITHLAPMFEPATQQKRIAGIPRLNDVVNYYVQLKRPLVDASAIGCSQFEISTFITLPGSEYMHYHTPLVYQESLIPSLQSLSRKEAIVKVHTGVFKPEFEEKAYRLLVDHVRKKINRFYSSSAVTPSGESSTLS